MFRRAVNFEPTNSGYVRGELIDSNPNAAPTLALMLYANRRRTNNVPLLVDYVGEALMSLVEPAGDRIIDEIRQMRGARLGSESQPTDPILTPVYDGVSLRDIRYSEADGLKGVNDKLDLIADQLGEGNVDEALENIRLIALVLGAI